VLRRPQRQPAIITTPTMDHTPSTDLAKRSTTKVITFRNFRLARAGLQPQAYCGVPRQANPSDQTNSTGGGLNEIR
jgi:hypothetical protein